MGFRVGDWVVINHYGDTWTTKIKEIKDGIVVKPETEIHVDENRWYHINRVRVAAKGEIELVQ